MVFIFRLFVFFILIFTFARAQAQTISGKLNRLLNNHYFEEALKLADKILEKDSCNYSAMYAAAVCHLHEYSASKSLYYLKKIIANYPKKIEPEVYNTLGQAYHANYMFDSAIKTFDKFLSLIDPNDEYRRSHTVKLIEESQNAKIYYKKPSPYFIKNLGDNINSLHPDHSPALYPDGTKMTFAIKNTSPNSIIGEHFFEEIYEVKLLPDSTWSKPVRVAITKNQIPLSFFEGGNKMLVYRYSRHGNLYVSEIVNGKWSVPYRLKGINTPAFEGHGHIFNNGNSIVFSSNKKTLHGDLDLYVSHKKSKEKWGKAQKLPAIINSIYDEDSPFMLNDGNTLFFSSKGHNTTGGYDVFKSTKDPKTGQWLPPKNLGHPVNTPRDDLFFTLDSTASYGFISSNREDSKGGKDLYYIGITQQPELQGKVLLDTMVLSHSKIKFKNLKTGDDFIATSDEKGSYSLALPSGETYLVDVKSGLISIGGQYVEVPKANVAEFTQQKDLLFESKDIVVSTNTILNDSQFLANKINKRIEGLLTDSEGNPWGKSFVMLAEKDGDIVSKVPVEDNGGFLISAVMELRKKYWIHVERKGIKFNEILEIDPNELALDSQTIFAKIKIRDLKKGDKLLMRDVYFESNSIEIKYNDLQYLERLANFLNHNPKLHIQVIGHTDNQGDDAFNLWLSRQRSITIKDLLVAKGVDKDRISVKGLGSARPVGPNNSSQQRQYNRRCEIEIKEL